MKKSKLACLLLTLLLSLSLLTPAALAADEPDLGATAAVLVDTGTGEVYFQKNGDHKVQPASTTKIMTAMLTLEAVARGDIALEDVVSAYDDCQYNMEDDSSHANPAIVPGEELTVEQLLYCAMLISANEACNILGEYISGSVNEFVALMNDRAAELGCSDTHFSNTNGIEDPDHYTTALDLSLIARQALQTPQFQQICGCLTYTVPATNMADERKLVNTNSLLNPESDFYYEAAYGIKTGFFTTAGYCLVSAAEKDGIDVVCVLLGGQDTDSRFSESRTLYDWMFQHYQVRQILNSSETLLPVTVKMGTTDSTGVRAENSLSIILPNDYDMSKLKRQAVLYHEQEGRDLEAPVRAGEALGEVTVVEMDDSGAVTRSFGSARLVATSTVEMSRLEYLRSQLAALFQEPTVRRIITILIVLLAIYLLLVIFYRVQRSRHLRSMRQAKRDRARRMIRDQSHWLDPSAPEQEPEDEEPAPAQARYDDYFDDFFDEP